MKRKILKRRSKKREVNNGKGTLARHLTVQLGQVAPYSIKQFHPSFTASLGENSSHLLNAEANHCSTADTEVDEKDFILSQDFFCTPDYITPEDKRILNNLDCNEDNISCPKSPQKSKTKTIKRHRQDMSSSPFGSPLPDHQDIVEPAKDTAGMDEIKAEKATVISVPKKKHYVSQAAVALRCRVMPPPCIRNPYLQKPSETDLDPFGIQRSKCAGFFPAVIGGDGVSRYHTDFHEIEQIGIGNFSCVFKVLKRIDGCLYAVKHCTRQLHEDTERRKALMEVQALAALGAHENIVGYHSSWFENEKLYIQMELCDRSLSLYNYAQPFTEGEVLNAMHQIARALKFIHEHGVAHLDVKPDNIYVKDGVYKLGDFGCATRLDKSLPIEEGDARYMPHEILNDKYDHLEKVDIFSLGAAIYELIKGSPLPESGPHFLCLRQGKLPLLPGHSLQLQNLLKVMMDPNPAQRPSAKELVQNPIFSRIQLTAQG